MTLRWRKVQDCPSVPGCDCPEPASPPSSVGQTASTDCGGSQGSSSHGSSVSSSSSSSSGSPPPFVEPCSPCAGSCTFTAGFNMWVPGLVWLDDAHQQCASGQAYGCRCKLPSRSPDFEGDTQASTCTCCPGCMWVWYASPHNYWGEASGGSNLGCSFGEACGGLCGSAPDWTPEEISPGVYACVTSECGEDMATGGSGSSTSSSSP
jgi:hypothetical protein